MNQTTNQPAAPVRIGVVGCGSVFEAYMGLAERLECRGLIQRVVGCDVREVRREVVLNKFGFARFTTDYHEVLDAQDVDLVLVLTSMQEHGPITRAALEAGKHVLVEKPMSGNLEEAAEIVALAKKSKGYLLPAPHVILSPTYQTIWKRLRRGDIGNVYSGRGLYGWSGPEWAKWFYLKGGGPLFDLGVYNVASFTGLLGPAKRVIAATGIAIPEREVKGERVLVEVEDNAHVILDFGGACFVVVTTGFIFQQYRRPALELYGTKGTLMMLGDDWAPRGYELWQNQVGAWQLFNETNPNWPWTDGLRHMVECIQKGKPPIIRPDHAFHILEIMLKAQEAGRTGRAQEIESTFAPTEFVGDIVRRQEHRIHDRSREA
jgi:predicted dehydrogenase